MKETSPVTGGNFSVVTIMNKRAYFVFFLHNSYKRQIAPGDDVRDRPATLEF